MLTRSLSNPHWRRPFPNLRLAEGLFCFKHIFEKKKNPVSKQLRPRLDDVTVLGLHCFPATKSVISYRIRSSFFFSFMHIKSHSL